MEWYYAKNNEKIGPLNDDLIKQLIKTGVITAQTPVWNEGMQDWMPASKSDLKQMIIKNAIRKPSAGTVSVGAKKHSPLKYIVIGVVIGVAGICYLGYRMQKNDTSQSQKASPAQTIYGSWSATLVRSETNFEYTVSYHPDGSFEASLDFPSAIHRYEGTWFIKDSNIYEEVTACNAAASNYGNIRIGQIMVKGSAILDGDYLSYYNENRNRIDLLRVR